MPLLANLQNINNSTILSTLPLNSSPNVEHSSFDVHITQTSYNYNNSSDSLHSYFPDSH